MALLAIIPLLLTALWLYSETKPDVVRRIVYGSLALVAVFWFTWLATYNPKEPAMRRMAYAQLKRAVLAGDTNAVLAALAIYRDAPARTTSGYATAFKMVRKLETDNRGQTK